MITDISNNSYSKRFLCDSISDIENLPTTNLAFEGNYAPIGSMAYIVENGKRLVLSPNNIWNDATNYPKQFIE